nr:sigma 54-interacting transcriptional regulator [Spirochaeta sp.]
GKLLRAIDRGEITPVGVDRPIHVDVRLVVATHRDLPEMVAAGAFREDLFERLQQLPIHVPPLRERDGDVELLAQAFLSQWNDEHGTTLRFSSAALEAITGYEWPRNVRQLQNVVRRMCVFTEQAVIPVDAVRGSLDVAGGGEDSGAPQGAAESAPAVVHRMWPREEPMDVREALEETERAFYAEALRRAGGNRSEAARLLGVQAPAFRKAIRERFPELA